MNPVCIGLRCLIILVIAVGLSHSVTAQEIPAGVRYKKASDEVNQKAKLLLETALSANSTNVRVDELFADAGVCGPLLWESLKDGAGKELRDGKQVVLIINGPHPVSKEGRAIVKSEQRKALWTLFSEKVKAGNPFSVRKAEAEEIRYFWATIPFDIEEPLLVIDFGKIKVLVNFTTKNKNPRIFWMDIVGDLEKIK